ncbi:MAG: T9SS type A sorting domain-containing protein, partial [Bacteroidetes bacterium]|nr:T9SS type A sorting domain-containing protein [Bacteroidota bacterium]
TYIELQMPVTANVTIKLYDIIGKEIATLKNELLFPGQHKIDVIAAVDTRLSFGQYIYRITTGGQNYSKSILIK